MSALGISKTTQKLSKNKKPWKTKPKEAEEFRVIFLHTHTQSCVVSLQEFVEIKQFY